MEASWEREAALRPAFSQIVELWQMWSDEDAVGTSRPSNNVTGEIFYKSCGKVTHADVLRDFST